MDMASVMYYLLPHMLHNVFSIAQQLTRNHLTTLAYMTPWQNLCAFLHRAIFIAMIMANV